MLANLRALFGVIVDIVLLRRGPENLPASSGLLVIVVALNTAVFALSMAAAPQAPANWQARILISAAVSLLWYRAAFGLTRKRERFTQTMTAVFAANTLFIPVLVPMASALMPYLEKQQTAPPALGILTLLVAGWLFVVQLRIVRTAFEWPIAGAIAFIFAQELAGAIIFALLFGVAEKAA
jgi:hypothetical protein